MAATRLETSVFEYLKAFGFESLSITTLANGFITLALALLFSIPVYLIHYARKRRRQSNEPSRLINL